MTAPVVIRKYGGEALASPSRIRVAAEQIAERAARTPIVVVASARRGVTDHLLGLIDEVGGNRISRSADRVVASGEIVSAALLALALQRLGRKAVALDGREAGLLATGDWSRARLRRVQPRRIREVLTSGAIPVVAGFQARRRRGLATLGRGGSDLTAVALAAALGGECELVKDVPALYTADPGLCPAAQPLTRVSHAFLAELARAGAKVCHPRAAVVAAREGVPIRFTHFQHEGLATVVGAGDGSSPVAVVLRPDIALLTGQAPAAITGQTVRRLLVQLRRLDAGAEVTASRDEFGWRLAVFVTRDSRLESITIAQSLGIGLMVTGDADLSTVSVIGDITTDGWTGRLRAAIDTAQAEPVRLTRAGRRLLVAVPSGQSIPLLRALHREFVELAAEPEGVACSA